MYRAPYVEDRYILPPTDMCISIRYGSEHGVLQAQRKWKKSPTTTLTLALEISGEEEEGGEEEGDSIIGRELGLISPPPSS